MISEYAIPFAGANRQRCVRCEGWCSVVLCEAAESKERVWLVECLNDNCRHARVIDEDVPPEWLDIP